jgi:NAD(P)-dependent dehydrogenase (short-subunit alcohol dehydrogenase family)
MNKTVLITGSTKGIGFETAIQLGQKGFRIIISGRDESRLNEAFLKVKKIGIEGEKLLMDMSDYESIRKAANQFINFDFKLDVIINNAAILLKNDMKLSTDSIETFEETIRTNCYGPLLLIKSFLPFLNSPGKIINISSGGGSMTDPVGGWSPAYCVSKSMLNALTRHISYELKEKKISVNSVCPGWVKTDMGGSGAPRSVKQGAETIVWLASDADYKFTGKFFRDKKEIPW